MTLTIRLLGRPSLAGPDGPVAPPRGAKAWGLLAYLLLSERPATRRELAGLLFATADDPLAALRWSLAELRRALGEPDGLRGDPPRLVLPPGAVVDVALLGADGPVAPSGCGAWAASCSRASPTPRRPPSRRGCRSSAGTWRPPPRRSCARPRWRSSPPAGRPPPCAWRRTLVALNALDEGHHELLVRSLAATGDRAAALAAAARCDELLRRELGVPPSPAVRRAAYASDGAPARPPGGGRAAAAGQLDAGLAAAAAGAVEAAVERLRRACAEAAACGDHELRGRALVALGTTLVHAVRGRDEEGAAVLHQAIAVAERAGDRATSAAAHRELGYIDVQAGRRERAAHWLAQAEALADSDGELAAVRGVQGMNDSDRADYPAALERLGESVELAERCGRRRQAAWSLSLLGRVHGSCAARTRSPRGDRPLARARGERALARVPPLARDAAGRARAARRATVDAAAERLERAFTVACQVEDPCWEGVSARAIGLLEARRGRADVARAGSPRRSRAARASPIPTNGRTPTCSTRSPAPPPRRATGGPGTPPRSSRVLAARTGMRELVVRAHVHLGRLGEDGCSTRRGCSRTRSTTRARRRCSRRPDARHTRATRRAGRCRP